ncbi:phosphatase PAP2 family protein, partial [Brevundimonas sp.]|uniref:acid phosphatase n=1 Tax=Brevundimonas sp. TaxID=1871086 RepID=UPI00182E59AD
AKRGFTRPRPFVTEPAETCIAPEPWLAASGSYPSGHAALGWAWALVLAEMAPDRADAVLARGLAYGESRVICGVHYPSDVEAGRIVGAAMVAALKADPAFQADFAVAARELDEARRAGR